MQNTELQDRAWAILDKCLNFIERDMKEDETNGKVGDLYKRQVDPRYKKTIDYAKMAFEFVNSKRTAEYVPASELTDEFLSELANKAKKNAEAIKKGMSGK